MQGLSRKIGRAIQLVNSRAKTHLDRSARERREKSATEFVLLYTMPKVGSTTVYESLLASGLELPIYHIHLLSDEIVRFFKEQIKVAQRPAAFERKLREVEHVRKLLAENPERQWRVVTLVRDPVARSISSFFQSSWEHFPDIDFAKGVSDEQRERLQSMYAAKREEHYEQCVTWFDKELCATTGIDALSRPFSPEQGYGIYDEDRFSLLAMRLEDLDRRGGAAFKGFLSMPSFQVARSNDSQKKDYGEFYREFARQVPLPEEFLDRMYSLPWVRHFYTADEIATQRARWSGRA